MTPLHHFCPFKSWQCNRSSGSGEAQEVEELEFEHLVSTSPPESKGQDNPTWILASTHYHPPLPPAWSNTEAESAVCFPSAAVTVPAWAVSCTHYLGAKGCPSAGHLSSDRGRQENKPLNIQ